MSKKYVIDLPDDAQYILINGASENHCYTRVEQVDDLEELNSDYINENFGELQDEAHKRGYDDGYEAGCSTAFKPVSDADYQRGLNDAWGCMKSIAFLNKPRDMRDFFGHSTLGGVLNGYTPSEAIAKLKAYEDKQTDCIEVGDEVRFLPNDRKGIVTACHVPDVYAENDKYSVFCGTTVEYVLRPHITKTGKHYDIASILEAMRE